MSVVFRYRDGRSYCILSQNLDEQKSYKQVEWRVWNMDAISIIARSKSVTGYSGMLGGGGGDWTCLTADFGRVGGEKVNG